MSKRVVVIGAGAVGLSTALYCAQSGHQVTVLESQPERRNGCSFGNAGMIVPSHFIPLAAPGMVAMGLKWMWNPESPFYIKPRLDFDLLSWGWKFWQAANAKQVAKAAPVLRDISLLSRSLFEDLQNSGLDIGLVKRGLLMLCKTQHGLDEEAHTAAKANELGIPAEVLDPKGTAAKDSSVTMNVAGSVYFPKDCHLPPERFLKALLERCRDLGVDFRWETTVTGFACDGETLQAVETSGGRVPADEVILAGGIWSPELAAKLGLNLPMQAGKGYSVTLKNPRQLPTLCAIFTEARVAVTPMDGALRVGGTMEMAGINDRINPRRVHGILRSVPQYYPEFREKDFAGIEPWYGLRPCPPDGMPYLGRTQRWKNLICATGHAMMGLSLAPATGMLAASLVNGESPAIDLSLFSPDRFA